MIPSLAVIKFEPSAWLVGSILFLLAGGVAVLIVLGRRAYKRVVKKLPPEPPVWVKPSGLAARGYIPLIVVVALLVAWQQAIAILGFALCAWLLLDLRDQQARSVQALEELCRLTGGPASPCPELACPEPSKGRGAKTG
jgi:hypothetical protein